MKKWFVISALLMVIVAFGSTEVKGYNPSAYKAMELDPIFQDSRLAKIAETMIAEPVFPEYLHGDQYVVGITYYDMQHNSTLGRNVAIDDEGGAHIAWMRSPNSLLSSRQIYYNYVDADGVELAGFEGTGMRADYALFKSGYCTIDAHGCTPYIAYHQANSAAADYHSQVSWDAASIESECGYHGGFAEATPAPPTVAYPECPDDIDNIVNIWPVIAVSEVDGDVHLISTTSNNDSTTCGGEYIAPKNYMAYYHATVDPSGSSSMTFDDAGVVLAEARGVAPTIGTARTRDEVAVATVYLDDYTCTWPDASNIYLYRSSDDGMTWDTTAVTGFGPDHRTEPYDTFFWGGYYVDTTVTPVDTFWSVDTFVCYTRPNGDVSITYDFDDNIHLTWTEGTYSIDSCTGETASSWPMSVTKHWTDLTGEITDIIDAYPAPGGRLLTPCGGVDNPDYFKNNFTPTISVDEDNTLYAIWHKYNGELTWMYAMEEGDTGTIYYDMSAANCHNNEIFGSYSTDNGATWIGPAPISNTYTPLCEAGDCKSELNSTISHTTDEYVHIFTILDADAGRSIQEVGEIVECDVLYARIPKGNFEDACEAFDQFHYVMEPMYPDTNEVYDFENPAPTWGIAEAKTNVPTEMSLGQNTPNPFNSQTAISFDVEQPGRYILEVYDLQGKLVNVLANSEMGRGTYWVRWEGTDRSGETVPSGTYLYRLRDEKGNATVRTMSLIK